MTNSGVPMARRRFLAVVGTGLAVGAATTALGQGPPQADAPAAGAPGANAAPTAQEVYNPDAPKQFIFTDYRHIAPGDLTWRSPEGQAIPVAGPPPPPVEAIADPAGVAYGIRLVAQRAKKEGPIEGMPGRVIYDGGVYRSWSLQTNYPEGGDLGSYSAKAAESVTMRYAESSDGYAWTSRELNTVPVSGVTGIDGDYVFIDPHGPSDERYKCIYNARVFDNVAQYWEQYKNVHPRHRDNRIREDYIYCLFGMVSGDGMEWRALPEPLMIHKGDTDNTVYYDVWLGKYVLYTRLYWNERRMVARAESDDFRKWSPVDPVVTPSLEDPPSFDVYTNARTCYPGLPEQHFMFPMYYRRYTQTTEVHLLTSMDGIRWDRVPGGPVLEPGDPGTWDGEFVYASRDMVPLGADRVAIPYGGGTHPHKYPRWPGVITSGMGWASWEKGRLCALTADEEGEFQTFEVKVTGAELRVNAKMRRAGALRVGLIGVDGRSVGDCDVITGDSLAHAIRWKGDSSLGRNPGDSVRLHFRLRAAELFGFEWA